MTMLLEFLERHRARHFFRSSHLKGPLQYLVAMIRGYHARAILLPVGRKFFARFLASRLWPVAGSSRRQLFSISLRQTQKKLFFVYFFNWFNFLFYVYFLNWVFQLKMSSKLSTYARKQKAQRWLQVDEEMQIAKSRHSKIFSVRSGIEMSMMRRKTEISIVPSSPTHKEISAVRGRDFDCSQTTWCRLRENCDRCANLWTVLPINKALEATDLQPLLQDSVEQHKARKEACKLFLKAALSREFHAHIDKAIIKAHDI